MCGSRGDLLLPEAELMRLVQIRPGDVYSREKLTQSAKAISDRMGSDGYAFANVNAVPEIDRENKTAAFTFYIDPGRRVYVRKVNISGNARTRDEVIRREIRQLEDGWYDATRIDRSKVRITRLQYFEDVNLETPSVPGSPDQVDLNITVTEKATGNLLVGVGYSSADGIVLSGSVSQNNVFGTGNSLTANVNTSKVNKQIALTYVEPYWTADGVSRSLELYFRNVNPSSLPVAAYQSQTAGAAIGFGIPLTETDSVNLGGRFEHTQLDAVQRQSVAVSRVRAGIRQLSRTASSSVRAGRATPATASSSPPVACCRARLPRSASATFCITRRNYLIQWFTPMPLGSVLMLRSDLGYGGGLGDKPLPFFKAYYAGGVGSVRGYETASLGPQDISGNTIGGRQKIVGNVELFFPVPGTKPGDQSVRMSVFADAGQIYDSGFEPNLESFRYSTGVGLAWNSPVGPLKFSYGYPLNAGPRDRIQHFQFQVGTVF